MVKSISISPDVGKVGGGGKLITPEIRKEEEINFGKREHLSYPISFFSCSPENKKFDICIEVSD